MVKITTYLVVEEGSILLATTNEEKAYAYLGRHASADFRRAAHDLGYDDDDLNDSMDPDDVYDIELQESILGAPAEVLTVDVNITAFEPTNTAAFEAFLSRIDCDTEEETPDLEDSSGHTYTGGDIEYMCSTICCRFDANWDTIIESSTDE